MFFKQLLDFTFPQTNDHYYQPLFFFWWDLSSASSATRLKIFFPTTPLRFVHTKAPYGIRKLLNFLG